MIDFVYVEKGALPLLEATNIRLGGDKDADAKPEFQAGGLVIRTPPFFGSQVEFFIGDVKTEVDGAAALRVVASFAEVLPFKIPGLG